MRDFIGADAPDNGGHVCDVRADSFGECIAHGMLVSREADQCLDAFFPGSAARMNDGGPSRRATVIFQRSRQLVRRSAGRLELNPPSQPGLRFVAIETARWAKPL